MTALVVALAIATAAEATVASYGDERLLLRTDVGDVVLAFYPSNARLHMEQVLRLVRARAYDRTMILDAVPGSHVRISGPEARRTPMPPAAAAAMAPIAPERNTLPIQNGSVWMASSVDAPVSALTIQLAEAPDPGVPHTVIGRVLRGQDVLMHIARLRDPSAPGPRYRVELLSATVTDASRLEGVRLAGPTLPRPIFHPGQFRAEIVGGGFILLLLVVIWLLPRRLLTGNARTAVLLALLIGSFIVFIRLSALASAWELDALAVAVFIGAAVLVRLMASFETVPTKRWLKTAHYGGQAGGRGTRVQEGASDRQIQ